MRKRKIIISILLIIVSVVPLQSKPYGSKNPDAEKRINRAVHRLAGAESSVDFEITNGSNTFFYILSGDNTFGYGCTRMVSNYRSGNGLNPSGEKAGSDHESFEYFIITDPEYRVIHLEVFNYQSTKGHEIMSRSWLRQFIGYEKGKSLDYGKDIDGISGASLSAKSITNDVPIALKMIMDHTFKIEN